MNNNSNHLVTFVKDLYVQHTFARFLSDPNQQIRDIVRDFSTSNLKVTPELLTKAIQFPELCLMLIDTGFVDPNDDLLCQASQSLPVTTALVRKGCAVKPSALCFAIKKNHIDVAKCLVNNGCPKDPSAVNTAVLCGSIEILSLLLENGWPCDSSAMDFNPADLDTGEFDIKPGVKYLIERGFYPPRSLFLNVIEFCLTDLFIYLHEQDLFPRNKQVLSRLLLEVKDLNETELEFLIDHGYPIDTNLPLHVSPKSPGAPKIPSLKYLS